MTVEHAKLSFREMISLLAYGFGLVRQLTPYYLIFLLLRSLIIAAQPLTVLFFSARIINQLSGAQDVQAIIFYVVLTVALSFVMSTARAFLTYVIDNTSGWERIFHRRLMLKAEHYAKMDYAHTEDSSVSEALARMDTMAMGNGLGLTNMYFLSPMLAENLFSLIFSILLLTGLTAGGGLIGWQAPVLFGLFTVGMLISIKYRSYQNQSLEKIYAENEKANTAASFYFMYTKSDEAAKDIRIYNQSGLLNKIFDDSFSSKTWLSFFFLNGRIDGFTFAVLSAFSGGLFLVTGYNVLNGVGTIGGIVQTVGAAIALGTALGTLAASGARFYNNAAFLKPLQDFLNLPDKVVKGTKTIPKSHSYQMEFRNVSFKYPGTETYVLKNLTLSFKAGKRMAVVGLNGSGKTTMIKLLCRLYDPTEGEILLDGINIKEYDYDQYIALFSVVFQDFALFPLWLGQNVAVGDEFDESRVNASLDAAGFTERLDKMPKGLDNILYKSFDEEGTQISGGEAQKIALARALYKDAPMVILDEPTAALDPIAEYEVYSAFDRIIAGKTAVFISHRLSSCRFCHNIAVFDKGGLVQQGTHEDLLEDERGLYFEMWNAQASHYIEEKPE